MVNYDTTILMNLVGGSWESGDSCRWRDWFWENNSADTGYVHCFFMNLWLYFHDCNYLCQFENIRLYVIDNISGFLVHSIFMKMDTQKMQLLVVPNQGV